MKQFKQYLPYIQILLLILAAIPVLKDYIYWDFNTILCLIISPLAFKIRYAEEHSIRYFFPASICFLLFFALKMKIFFLLGIGMSLFFLIENHFGKLSEIPLLLLAIFSPTLSYLSNIFTFPIKLQLSKWAANSLNFMGIAVKETGNYFEWGGMSFSIDTACMGLNLVITSCILTLLWIAFLELRQKKRLGMIKISGLLILTFLCVILANFSRIIVLVILHSMPNTLGHEMIGLMSLGLYVCLPMYFLIQKSYQKWGINIGNHAIIANKYLKISPYLFSILWISCTFLSFTFKPIENTDKNLLAIEKDGFNKEITTENIVKFSNDSTIIYLKPAAKFWGCDHSPLICWQASGYQFEKIQEKKFYNTKLYVAELTSPNLALPTLYTAWWYDNGTDKTISQSHWRWEMMRGAKPFHLVNVSTLNESELEKACKMWLL